MPITKAVAIREIRKLQRTVQGIADELDELRERIESSAPKPEPGNKPDAKPKARPKPKGGWFAESDDDDEAEPEEEPEADA